MLRLFSSPSSSQWHNSTDGKLSPVVTVRRNSASWSFCGTSNWPLESWSNRRLIRIKLFLSNQTLERKENSIWKIWSIFTFLRLFQSRSIQGFYDINNNKLRPPFLFVVSSERTCWMYSDVEVNDKLYGLEAITPQKRMVDYHLLSFRTITVFDVSKVKMEYYHFTR